jgi:hypothetical protein
MNNDRSMPERFYFITTAHPRRLERLIQSLDERLPGGLRRVFSSPCGVLVHAPSGAAWGLAELQAFIAQEGCLAVVLAIDPKALVTGHRVELYSSEAEVMGRFAALRGKVRRQQAKQRAQVPQRLVDRILDRISTVGLAAIHPIERRVLDRFSQQHR